MRIVVTGAGGMLGQDLVPVLESEHEVFAYNHSGLDITDKRQVSDILDSIRPDIVINCAAYTQVDKAEEETERAFRINGLGVHNLALECDRLGIVLCHVSTDYVFDGSKKRPYTPFDNTSPVNAYGESKLAGERFLQWVMKRFYIVRTSWLYGAGGGNFVKTIHRIASERDEIRVVSDQIGSPTWTVTLSEGIKSIIESEVYGIHHVTDRTDGGISWFDFARAIVELSGLKTRVIPITTDQYPTPAKRPSYSVLETYYTEVSTGFSPPHWMDSLRRFLESFL